MKIGYLLPTRDRAARGEYDLGGLIEQARRAESLGFDSVWAGESPIARPRPDPLLVLAGVAAVTDRVTLGTAVLLPALRHPILLAQQIATLDRISEGRLVIGAGGGFPTPATEEQFAALGVGYARRISRLVESLEVMRRLWSGRTVTFEGEHVDFRDIRLAPLPTGPDGPPLWLAGGGGHALRRVAHHADGWLPYPPSAAAYAQDWSAIQQAAVRTVTPALYATLCLDDDPVRARQRLRVSIERYYNAPLEAVETIQAMFAGTPEQAAEWLSSYVVAGARHVVIRLAAEDHRPALEELAGRVMPLLTLKDDS